MLTLGGGIDISHTFIDATGAVGGTTSVLSFDIAKQSLDYNGQQYQTDPNAQFQFKIDGIMVAKVDASQLTANSMTHFDVNISSYDHTGDTHTLELVDVTGQPGFGQAGYAGFSVDSIAINDWIV